MKVSIVGAGNVGSTLAERVLAHKLADIALVDIVGDLAKGKAYDLIDAAPIMGYTNKIEGSSEHSIMSNSDIVVITAGLARRPGMTREDLISKNSQIVGDVLKGVKRYAPEAFIVMVTNPLDIMTYIAYKKMGCKRTRIIGMAGNLDTARYRALLSEELSIIPDKIEAAVLGSHGDTMVPLVSRTFINKKPLKDIMSSDRISAIVNRTKKRGGEIVSLLKSGSAYYSPSAACYEIIEAVVSGKGKILTCSCILKGEYGIDNCALGVPAKIGKMGVEEILEWELLPEELADLKKSADVAREALATINS